MGWPVGASRAFYFGRAVGLHGSCWIMLKFGVNFVGDFGMRKIRVPEDALTLECSCRGYSLRSSRDLLSGVSLLFDLDCRLFLFSYLRPRHVA